MNGGASCGKGKRLRSATTRIPGLSNFDTNLEYKIYCKEAEYQMISAENSGGMAVIQS